MIALLLVDPLLARSVGFWLSVGATAGVTTIGPVARRAARGLGLLARRSAITLGAQVGVLLPAVLVFGQVPLVSVPANVLAGPVAGGVMLYGLPAGLLRRCRARRRAGGDAAVPARRAVGRPRGGARRAARTGRRRRPGSAG